LQSLVLGLGAWLAIEQLITPGMMIAGSILMARVLAPIDQLIGAWRQWSGARQAYLRLSELLRMQPPRPAGMPLPAPQAHGGTSGRAAAGQQPALPEQPGFRPGCR
jgi:ATP-binding cassette subfamily C exporter for protease/lipase